jgi:2-oxoglutarate dehydrogenase E1 component
VLWEAQFGDFGNSAQVIIDQFIVSGLAKWGQTTRLTLLLPHGYEGSGPEHSSGRLERFLQLAAEGNIRVANLTTPAQYFHLLRRQARIAKQRPLIIMTPKSLLRLPQATNRLEHLSETRFFPVLGEPRVNAEKVTRLVLCTGKIYYDLVGHPSRQDNEAVGHRARRAALSLPRGADPRAGQQLPEPARGRVGPGGAAQHGRPRPHVAALMQILPQHLKFGYIGRPSAPRRARATPPPTPASRTASCAPRSTWPARHLYPAKLPGDR